jgi:hypothetical protein
MEFSRSVSQRTAWNVPNASYLRFLPSVASLCNKILMVPEASFVVSVHISLSFNSMYGISNHDMWVPVTVIWCILALWMGDMAYGYRRQLQIYWISSCRQPIRGGPSVWGLGKGLTTPHYKKPACYETLYRIWKLVGSWEYGSEPLCSIKGWEFLD